MRVLEAWPALLALVAVGLSPVPASGALGFTAAGHSPQAPDHETFTTFHATIGLVNDTYIVDGNATNGTATNGTGTNGTATNGTGTNGTGTNVTINVTACQLVLETGGGRGAAAEARHNMTRSGPLNDFVLSAGPWPPGTEVPYRFEATLSNGTVIRSNSSLVRTPELLAIKWHRSAEDAAPLARGLGRPLMVLVYSGFDRAIRSVDGSLSGPSIIDLSAALVCVRIDNETSPSFGREHHLGRLPVLLFLNATTGNETGRVADPRNGALVEKQMRHVLGLGPAPRPAEGEAHGYRLEALALGAALVAGPVALLVRLRMKKRLER
ncbi:MAG: hypothetical protein FJ149_02950 [Euryarchaeota archaeon]|nr:hypothetical protein [Euryarchaeota archaeon]